MNRDANISGVLEAEEEHSGPINPECVLPCRSPRCCYCCCCFLLFFFFNHRLLRAQQVFCRPSRRRGIHFPRGFRGRPCRSCTTGVIFYTTVMKSAFYGNAKDSQEEATLAETHQPETSRHTKATSAASSGTNLRTVVVGPTFEQPEGPTNTGCL